MCDPCSAVLGLRIGPGLLALAALTSSALAQDPSSGSAQAPPRDGTSPPALPDQAAQDLAQLFAFLDRDGNGLVEPYEGADAILLLNDQANGNSDQGLDYAELLTFLGEESRSYREERMELLHELDENGDGSLALAEIPEYLLAALEPADTDANGLVTASELLELESLGDPGQAFEAELLQFLSAVDHDGDGAFALADLPQAEQAEMREEFLRLDRDSNGLVTRQELMALVEEELRGAVLEVQGSRALMRGVISASTPGRVLELILEHPDVTSIAMALVPGSMDDEANLRAARYVRRHGLGTAVVADGEVASGGTDFFLAGTTRSAEPRARFGVHSWSSQGQEGREVPRDDPEHRMYLDFYGEMGIPESFYWFTLKAAPAHDIHWMTPEEVARYDLLTAPAAPQDRAQDPDSGNVLRIEIDTSGSPNGIVPIPEGIHPALSTTFTKYTRILAPNRRPIHFFAQSGVHDDQLLRARKVMAFYLSDAPGTRFGANKTAVANAMADRGATLVYFDTERDAEQAFHGELGDLDLFFQDLYAEESVVEGSAAYLDNSVRDATLEEVFHLVQGAGIQPALPEYHARIEEAMRSAVGQRRWFTNPEWEAEGSSSFEYIISVIDVYYGFWAHDPHGNGESFHGEYRYCSREAITEHDPLGVEVLREFLPETFELQASLAAEFSGLFTLNETADLAYTRKSQYLSQVSLTGRGDSGLIGNRRANSLTGNDGNNHLEGRGGDDRLLGGAGQDTAVFQGPRSEYSMTRIEGVLHVVDRIPARDGSDQLQGIERLRFADGTIDCPH